MNKRQTRYTPFKGEFKMPVDEFCQKYGLDLDTVMTRMNVRYWEDFDALVIPQNMGMTSADKIRRALMLMQRFHVFHMMILQKQLKILFLIFYLLFR